MGGSENKISRDELLKSINEKYETTEQTLYSHWPESTDHEVREQLYDFACNPFKVAETQCNQPQTLALEEDTSGVTVQFLGVGGLLFDDGDDFILVDPYFTRPEWNPIAGALFPGGARIRPSEQVVEKFLEHSMKPYGDTRAYPEVVFCTHGHFDHALDIGCVSKVIKDKNGKYPMVFASRSVLNVALSHLLTDDDLADLARKLEDIRYNAFKTGLLKEKLAQHWRETFPDEEHGFNEDEDKMILKDDWSLEFGHLIKIFDEGRRPDDSRRGRDFRRKEHDLHQLAVLMRVDESFDSEDGRFEIEGKSIPELLKPLRQALDTLYFKFNFIPIDGWNLDNSASGDRQFTENEIVTLLGKNNPIALHPNKTLNPGIQLTAEANSKSDVKLQSFELKALKGFHINIPNFSCRGTNPVPLPLPYYTSDMNTGVLFNPIIEHCDIKGSHEVNGQMVPGKIMAQGSANFHRGQMSKVFSSNNPIPTMILGAPGISLGAGNMAGEPGIEFDGRGEFYHEIVIAGHTTRILFHHWDHFNRKLNNPGGLGWFKNIFGGFCVSRIIKQFKRQLTWRTSPDELYQGAKRKWDKWNRLTDKGKVHTDEPPRPDSVRSFKFLPLFRRIKL